MNRPHLIPRAGFPICLGLAASITLARAQDPVKSDGPDSAVTLDAMTVTATRESDQAVIDYKEQAAAVGTKTDTPLIETPQAISIISRDQMDLRNAKGVAESLRYTASVSTDTYGEDPRGYDWVKIRGFEVFNSQYLDGLRLSNYEFPEAFGLDHVEVMKGPSSVLYGQSTSGGLINSVSKRPRETAFGEVSGEIGTGQSYEFTFDQGAPVDKDGKVLYRLTALLRDNEEDSNGSVIDAQRMYLAPSVTWKITDATTLTVLASYFNGESTQFPSFAAAADGSPTKVLLNNKSLDYERNEIFHLGYQLEHRINPDLVFRQKMRVSRYDVRDGYLNALRHKTSDPTIIKRSASIYNSDARSVNLDNQLEYKLSGGRLEQTLLAGLDWGYSWHDDEYFEKYTPKLDLDLDAPDYTVKVPVPTKLLSDSRQEIVQTGLYAQDQLKLDSRWVATLSARNDWASSRTKERTAGSKWDDQDDNELTGRAGFTYLADNGFAPYVSYATSFYPNSGADAAGNTFDPTEGRQYEIGLKYAPKNFRGGATLSVFDLTESNVLTTDTSNSAFMKASGEWNSRGIEFEGNLGITDNVDLLVSATYDDVEITDSDDGDQGNTPALTPEKSASAWLNYTFRDNALAGLTLGAGVRYMGPTYSDNFETVKNDGYVVVDLAARYVRGAWTYAANAGNIFNEVQDIYDGTNYTNSTGSTLSLSVAYHW